MESYTCKWYNKANSFLAEGGNVLLPFVHYQYRTCIFEVIVIKTEVFFVRHAESLFRPGEERSRGLSEKGTMDAVKVSDVLVNEDIDIIISSPYERAILTVKSLAERLKKEIILKEDLRERKLAGDNYEITREKFIETKRMVFDDWEYSLPGGESSKQAQERAINVFLKILDKFKGKNIVVGTHGDIMTLIMNYFNNEYGYEFWQSTTMPDIYELVFMGITLESVRRRWNE
jgi:2,3-bisphosphoglycerate-dependent phosphoglycerate mutase